MRKKLSLLIVLLVVFCSSLVCAQEPIKLLDPDLKSGKLLMEALNERKTTRSFSDQQLAIDTLSNLLWAAFGINREDGKRTAPSAMNFREIDIYVAMPEGVFIYDPENQLLSPTLNEDVRDIVGTQEFTNDAALSLVYVADFSKIILQDMDDNAKEILASADAAYISQNVYLFCASEGLATVVLGWVDKLMLSEKLGLNENQKIIFSQPVGYSK